MLRDSENFYSKRNKTIYCFKHDDLKGELTSLLLKGSIGVDQVFKDSEK